MVACSNSNGEDSKVEQNVNESNAGEIVESDVSVKFAGIDIVYKRPAIQIAGDVQTTEDHFYYKLDNDGQIIVEETKVEVGHLDGEWSTFEFEIDIEDKELTNQDVPFLTFYGKDGERIINPNYVPVDLRFY